MAHQLKTEHSGSKKGEGVYWGRKREAKKVSKKKRRVYSKVETKREVKVK